MSFGEKINAILSSEFYWIMNTSSFIYANQYAWRIYWNRCNRWNSNCIMKTGSSSSDCEKAQVSEDMVIWFPSDTTDNEYFLFFTFAAYDSWAAGWLWVVSIYTFVKFKLTPIMFGDQKGWWSSWRSYYWRDRLRNSMFQESLEYWFKFFRRFTKLVGCRHREGRYFKVPPYKC